MSFQIETKNTLSGTEQIIRFPEKDLDRKALYTIQEDLPDFLVPFHYTSIEGQAECAYDLGGLKVLRDAVLPQKYQPAEYVAFWEKIFRPLLDCDDWFLTPLSFVLDADCLYYSEAKGTVLYLYVPSRQSYSAPRNVREMTSKLSSSVSVTDDSWDVKVLRFIIDQKESDFQVAAFLQMLHEMQSQGPHSPSISPDGYEPPKQPPFNPNRNNADYGGNGNNADHGGNGSSAGGGSGENNSDRINRLMGRGQNDKKSFSLSFGKKAALHLAKTGDRKLSKSIRVNIQPGSSFTIGRYSKQAGHGKSDFEFPTNTRGVSRNHACIRRQQNGDFVLLDKQSMYGTFLDGNRLKPGEAYPLHNGCQISFGTAGADYIWEE